MKTYVTATNQYPPLVKHGGKVLKLAVSCSTLQEVGEVEKRMEGKGYFKHIRRSKSKPYYDKKRYVTRYQTASAFLK